MKKPVVDYRGFRLSKLCMPQYSHLLLLLGWVGYFTLYFLTEKLIPAEACHVIHSPLDDRIPFCEWFLIPYVFWYLLVAGSLLHYALYNTDNFRKLQIFIMITQAIAMLVYILWPSMQDLRPETFPRDNLLTRALAFLYAFDTPTGVLPSLHVAYSLGIASVCLKDRTIPTLWKVLLCVLILVICAATAFIKQHSVLDIAAAVPLSVLAEALVYGKSWWLPRLRALCGRKREG